MNTNGEGFYITLPNDSSRNFFPENSPSEYTTKLPQWIQLNGEWEMGLHSMFYTPWNILEHLDEPIAYTPAGSSEKRNRVKDYRSTIQNYIESVNESISTDDIDFKIQNGKVTITLSPGYEVYLRREQAIALGFMKPEDRAEVKKIARTETGLYKANLRRETNIYVYCDIVQPQIVGDKTTHLLGVVPCERDDKPCEKVYEIGNIHYVPLQTKSFQSIKILLRSSTNESIPFEYRRASITIHLKPSSNF